MNADTCAVLASVYPLVLITTVIEARAVHFNLRIRKFFRWSTYAGMGTSIVGLALAVLGVNHGGYSNAQSIVVWAIFWIALTSLTIAIVGIGATLETEDDAKAAQREKKAKRTNNKNHGKSGRQERRR